jgi:hypothetical protein
LLTICIRALDYCPPVSLTFGEYLRALITLDSDMVGDDALGYRIAIIEAFRKRGIFPADVRTLSVESLRWHAPLFDGALPDDLKQTIRTLEKMWMYRGKEVMAHLSSNNFELKKKEVDQLKQDTVAFLRNDREYSHMIASIAKRYVKQIVSQGLVLKSGEPNLTLAKYLGLVPGVEIEVAQAVPTRRVMPNGSVRNDMLVRMVQTVYIDPYTEKAFDGATGFEIDMAEGKIKVESVQRPISKDDHRRLYPFSGGCTLVIDMDRDNVPYIIKKKLHNSQRLREQLKHQNRSSKFGLRDLYHMDSNSNNPFALIHRGGTE